MESREMDLEDIFIKLTTGTYLEKKSNKGGDDRK